MSVIFGVWLLHIFGLDAKSSVRYCHKATFIDEFTCYTTDAIGFVFDTDKCILEVAYELFLGE